MPVTQPVLKRLAVAVLVVAALAALAAGCGQQERPPPLPQVYSGSVTVAGVPAPEGLRVVAVVDGFQTALVEVQGSRYSGLTVAPPGARYQGKRVRLYLASAQGRVQASEQATFQTGSTPEVKGLDLTFPSLPGQGAPSETDSGGWLPWLGAGVLALAVVLGAVGALQRVSRHRSRGRW